MVVRMKSSDKHVIKQLFTSDTHLPVPVIARIVTCKRFVEMLGERSRHLTAYQQRVPSQTRLVWFIVLDNHAFGGLFFLTLQLLSRIGEVEVSTQYRALERTT